MVSPVKKLLKKTEMGEIASMHPAANGIASEFYPPKTPKGAKGWKLMYSDLIVRARNFLGAHDLSFVFLALFGVFGGSCIESLRLRGPRSFTVGCVLLIIQSLCAFSVRAEIQGDIPAGFPPARYEQMVKKSPFALATPVATAAAAPGYAANLYVTGIAKIGTADFVSISSRDQQSKFSLLSGETGKDDITLVSVEWSDQIGKSKVTIKKGAEFAVLEFDQAALQTPMQAAGQGPQLPGQPAMPQLPQMGGGGGPGNGRRIILPQPNGGPVQPGMPGAPRQRMRLINSKPQQ